MRLSEKKYFNNYKVRRNDNGEIVDLIYLKTFETLEGKKASFKNNLNDSKLMDDFTGDLKTYNDNNGNELTAFIDYDIERIETGIILIDRIKNKINYYVSTDDVADYITAHVNGTYNNIYKYNNNNIIVLR